MTIREIAKAANVSVATVSKVLNRKDESISAETRERVMKIVRAANYTPYANLRGASQSATMLLALFMEERPLRSLRVTDFIRAARERGYNLIICTPRDAQEAYFSLSSVCAHRVDGVIWAGGAFADEKCLACVREKNIPFLPIDTWAGGADGVDFDVRRMGREACEALAERRHKKIVCALDSGDARGHVFAEGVRERLFAHGIPFTDSMVRVVPTPADAAVWLHECTGVVCESEAVAQRIAHQAAAMNRDIPRDLSVICAETESGDTTDLSMVMLPREALSRCAVSRLIGRVERRADDADAPFDAVYALNHPRSLAAPSARRSQRITVVGAINMDTIISFDRMPELGETVMVAGRVTMPGGKGMNQALGAARLGADVSLIGRVGADYDGGVAFGCLREHGVSSDGVTMDADAPTGHAFIYVQRDGESSIVVHRGANSNLTCADIDRCEALFEGAAYCLLQMEIPVEVTERAAQIARKHGARVALKPCSVSAISDALLRNVDILLPNRMEIQKLVPGSGSLADKARHFVERGAKHVILTLGHRGCYLCDDAHSMYFPAASVRPIDTTGAADAFAATLAVCLSRGTELPTAIRYAICASGLSTTMLGVPPSLVDQHTIELFMMQHPETGEPEEVPAWLTGSPST